jgi:imidazolonepropionase-like amidohydrolase
MISLIRNGTLIDGTGSAPLPNAGVLIAENLIRGVGSISSLGLPHSAVREIDAGGGYILPGFVDTHVHLTLEGINIERDMATPFSLRFYKSVQHMRRTLEAGITSVRDAGGSDAGVKQAVEEGVVLGPRMQISITPLTITGGHLDGWMRSGDEFHLLPAHPGLPDGRCDGLDGVRLKVGEVLRAGAEVVKVLATGGVLSPTDHPNFTQFSPEELDVIVRKAAYRGGHQSHGPCTGERRNQERGTRRRMLH